MSGLSLAPESEASKPEPLLKLAIDQTLVQTGSVAVRWCLSSEAAKKLTPDQVLKRKVLLLVIPKSWDGSSIATKHETQRSLHKLSDQMAYVEFQRPGENHIFAVVLRDVYQRETSKDVFLSRENGSWCSDVFADESQDPDDSWGHLGRGMAFSIESRREPGYSASLSVDVPTEVFAKPPPPWERELVSELFRNGPINQCDYRRQRMIAYPVMGPVMLARMLFRAAAAFVLMMLTFDKVDFMPVIHPLRNASEDVWKEMPKKPVLMQWRLPLIQFSPLVLLIAGGLFYKLGHSILWAVLYAVWTSLAVTLGGVLVMLVVYVWFLFMEWLFAEFGALKESRAEFKKLHPEPEEPPKPERKSFKERFNEWSLDRERTVAGKALASMVCDSDQPCDASLASLPSEFRTVKLRFYDLKTRVCRPFAQ